MFFEGQNFHRLAMQIGYETLSRFYFRAKGAYCHDVNLHMYMFQFVDGLKTFTVSFMKNVKAV